MPSFTIPYVATLDSRQPQQTSDLDLDFCTECIDNININHETTQKFLQENERKLNKEQSEILSRCGYYSRSMPKSIPVNPSYKRSSERHRIARSLTKTTTHNKGIASSPCPAQTCVDSFYTPTNRTLPPIIGMRELNNAHVNPLAENSEHVVNNRCRKENDNAFHFPKSSGIEQPNGYLPWEMELNDSDCDDGMFDREQIEDMNVDQDSDLKAEYHQAYPEIVPSYTTDEQTHNLFMDAFIQNNRLDCVSQVMGYHPDYLRIFLNTQSFLLREDGPLSYEYRHYIAILAAARHHCTYLVELHEQDFLLHNGNPEWLKGLEYAPRKLRDLYEINKLLAHQPWLITKEHMVKLLKSSEPWSLSELMHAIILLTHFHALSSFVFGCGISSEVDAQGGHTYTESVLTSSSPPAPPTSSATSPSSSAMPIAAAHHTASTNGKSRDQSPRDSVDSGQGSGINGCSNSGASNRCASLNGFSNSQIIGDECGMDVEALMEKMRQLTEAAGEETSQEELLKRFHSVEKNTAEIAVPNMKKPASKSEIMKYVQDDDFAYTDFATRKCTNVSTFRACDYSWDDHGFSLANRLYADIGNYLDDKYNTAANMTYYTMGDLREVDTSSFRRAIWNYIHTMYGICHDDYDYAEVNQLLEINLKAYIKTLTCYPERLQKKDFDGVMKGFKHSEKVHVNVMLMEARQQAELLYALRALNRYHT